MKLDLLLWALVLPFAWAALALLPLMVVGPVAPHGLLCIGMAGATCLAFVFERRTPLGQVLPLSWAVRSPAQIAAAFLAGAGANILGSELVNVALTVAPVIVSSDAAQAPGVGANDPAWMRVMLRGVVMPASTALLFGVLIARPMLVLLGRRRALLAVAAWGSLLVVQGVDVPQALPRHALLIGLATWAHTGSGSVWLPLAVFAPSGLVDGLMQVGIAPGIVGFDDMPAGEVAFQPIWFDLLGAALLAVGAGLLIRAFESAVAPTIQDE